jgi:tRNA uridine 5-carboxymethylaminomethyl modification enzyme
MRRARFLSDSIKSLGFTLYRFKTGTPARVDKRSIDFSQLEIQNGDPEIIPFSFENEEKDIYRKQIPCYLTYTNEKTHEIIRANLSRSPMYSGVIEGTGARYCPSIEDKVVRFADKNRHQIFIEPEGEFTNEMYIAGLSSSLPEDVQIAVYRSVKGLENCEFTRNAYAIEYDCIDATQLKPSLESMPVKGLFFAGQINGSSGYEEAAAQGIIAGLNASLCVRGKPPVIIGRDEGYIGVLIDDLTTKGTKEPYRMMTSRAEYRLLLRQDNADLRLSEIGFKAGLLPTSRHEKFIIKKELIEREIERVKKVIVSPKSEINEFLRSANSAPVESGIYLTELIRRPELDYDSLAGFDPERESLPRAVRDEVNLEIKYEGYISRQKFQVERFKKLESKKIPPGIDYLNIKGLRVEARQKLAAAAPENIGRAGRLPGVNPSDISVLLVCLEAYGFNESQI